MTYPDHTDPTTTLQEKLRAARRLNAVGATVADGHRHLLGFAPDDAMLHVSVVVEMLDSVIAALGGETDPDALRLHPEHNATHRASLAHLLEAPLEDR